MGLKFQNFCSSIACCDGVPESVKAHRRGSVKPVSGDSLVPSTNSSGFSFSNNDSSNSSGYISKERSGSLHQSKPSYWDKKRIKPIFTLRGSTNQVTCGGLYAGAQCTSIAFSALNIMAIRPPNTWDTALLDNVIRFGDKKHVLFREVYRLSTHYDNRVALDDLPPELRMEIDGTNSGVNNYIKPSSGNLFLQNTEKTKSFMCRSLYTYMKQEFRSREGMLSCLLTVGDYSYSFMKDEKQCWWLFDSHGSLKIPKMKRDVSASKLSRGATLTKFTTAKAMVKLLLDHHGAGTQVEVREVVPVPDIDLTFAREEKKEEPAKPKSPTFSCSTEYLSTAKYLYKDDPSKVVVKDPARFKEVESDLELVSYNSADEGRDMVRPV